MKANAPEKIYLNQDDGFIWHCRSYKDDIEYTRTDVFIEMACKWLKEQDEMVGISFTEDFIARFQNYMKGVKV